tara:strand:- start:909 stop:1451 length:543 start_codon:yes stop_codon:yes gene_type:complete
MIRIIDIILSFLGLIFLTPLLPIIFLLARIETGSAIFKQLRVGKNHKQFILFKFRSMKIDTPSRGTHLIKKEKITKFGKFLRTTKLDEILQLFNVLIGNMSLVGPRPCLLSQKKLIIEREKRRVFNVRPGITGLAQIQGVTMKDPIKLAKIDSKMIKQMSIFNYFYYIIMSVFLVFKNKS